MPPSISIRTPSSSSTGVFAFRSTMPSQRRRIGFVPNARLTFAGFFTRIDVPVTASTSKECTGLAVQLKRLVAQLDVARGGKPDHVITAGIVDDDGGGILIGGLHLADHAGVVARPFARTPWRR